MTATKKSLEQSLRRKVFSNSLLRMAGRAVVHLRPKLLGSVSEAYNGEFAIRPFGFNLRYELGPRDTIGNVLHWCGYKTFETETLPYFVKLAASARGMLDIGANTGLFSLLTCAANPKARVIAWEPVPYLHAKLKKNLELNGFTHQCEVRSTAVSAESGEAILYIPEETTTASLNSEHKDDGVGFPVKIETIDESVPSSFPLDLIKIDVETYEYQAFLGMRETLKRAKPAVIFEVLPGQDPTRIEKLFSDLGFRLSRLSLAGPVEVKEIKPEETIDHNFLATPR